MRKRKVILLVGTSGFVGTHLAMRLRQDYKVFATFKSRPFFLPGVTSMPMDALDRDWIKRIVYTVRPDVIVWAAGSNSVEQAEKDARTTERIHAGGPALLSTVADIFQPKFILLSSSYVFDGRKGNYHEGDTMLPTSALGKAKVNSENTIKGRSLNYLIVRSVPLFGRGNGLNLSLLDHMRMALGRGQRIEVSDKEVHSFAPIHEFVDFLALLIEAGPRNKVLHFGGLTRLSYFAFAKRFAERFQFDPELVLRAKDPLLERGLTTPISDYSLNCTQSAELFKIAPLTLEAGFDLLEKRTTSSP